MQKEIKEALKTGLQLVLPVLRNLSQLHKEPRWVYVQRPNRGGWDGTQELAPSLWQIFRAAEKETDAAAETFLQLFFSTYPEYGEGKLVGVSGGSYGSLTWPKTEIFNKAIIWIYQRLGSFENAEALVDQIANEFEEFVESKTVRIRMQAKLLNFGMEGDRLAIAKDVLIRRLNPREISELNSKHSGAGRFGADPFPISEFVVELEYEGRKAFSPELDDSVAALANARSKLDDTINCLRTFKSGYVGIKWVTLETVKFCPLSFGSYASHLSYIPPGSFHLTERESTEMAVFAQDYFSLQDSALLTACARLADSESRLRPQDAVLDAVVGMEAVLLAGLRSEDRRSELKYRFSINFASLQETPEARWDSYKIAKDLYDLRSAIAHGGELGTAGIRIGKEKVPIGEAAKCAKAILRQLIRRFLPDAKNAPHKRPDFWEKAYFGISPGLENDRPNIPN